MNLPGGTKMVVLALLAAWGIIGGNGAMAAPPVKLVFIHHSCGENWLADDNGGLGAALAKAGYFVSDTNYGWGPGGIGDRTDIPNWPEWFCTADSPRVLAALFQESGSHAPYARPLRDPGGPNRIVMFKSCFPNSELGGKPGDPPNADGDLTVGGAKGVYLQLRKAFLARPETFFMIVTAPPVQAKSHARNARAFNTWLTTEWLKGYPGKNVAVFDFYTVLTGKNNHHRLGGGKVEYVNNAGGNTLAYPSDDDHPSTAGNRKATAEFVPFLDFHVRQWLASNPPAVPSAGVAAPGPPVKTPDAGPPPRTAGPDPVENPPPAPLPRPANPEKGDVANFATAADGWEVFQDEKAAGPLMSIRRPGRDGSLGLVVTYNLGANTWAACAKVLPEPTDWRKHDGLAVRWLAPTGCQPILIAYENGPDNSLLHFECPLPEGTGAWQDATLTWSRFRQPEWQGNVNQPFRPERARGVAFILHPGDAPVNGELRIAQVRLQP
jgi:hypothetical protein